MAVWTGQRGRTNVCLRGPLSAGEGYAWDALEVVDEGDVRPADEQFGEGVALAVTYFQGDQTAGFEGLAGLRDEAAVDVESVGSGEESGGGFVLANLGVERGSVGERDIGRVADDGVEGLVEFVGGQGGEEVGEEEADAGGEAVRDGV